MKMTEKDVLALAARLDGMDYYRLFRVDPKARVSQIRPTYLRLRRSFHPDLFLRASPELRGAVERITCRVVEAYSVLRNPLRRKAYDAGLTKGKLRASREEEREAVTRSKTRTGVSPRGKELYGKAIQSERGGDFKSAIASMKLATTFEPINQFFKAKLAELENLAREEKKKARS